MANWKLKTTLGKHIDGRKVYFGVGMGEGGFVRIKRKPKMKDVLVCAS